MLKNKKLGAVVILTCSLLISCSEPISTDERVRSTELAELLFSQVRNGEDGAFVGNAQQYLTKVGSHQLMLTRSGSDASGEIFHHSISTNDASLFSYLARKPATATSPTDRVCSYFDGNNNVVDRAAMENFLQNTQINVLSETSCKRLRSKIKKELEKFYPVSIFDLRSNICFGNGRDVCGAFGGGGNSLSSCSRVILDPSYESILEALASNPGLELIEDTEQCNSIIDSAMRSGRVY